MSGRSSAEYELREHVVLRLREMFPAARIIHELNVAGTGSNRIDVAAVSDQAIIGVEIKSERDTLKRLDEQWAAFTRCCHFVFVAAHDRHFAECGDHPSDWHLNHPLFLGKMNMERHVWRWPTPVEHRHGSWFRFDRFRDIRDQPKAADLLGMLWASELRSECALHRLPSGSRETRPAMIREMVWHLTGREICHAVCRQLRARSFAEADAPVMEAA